MHWVASNYSLREPSPKATEEPDHSLLRIDGSQEEQRVVSPAPPPKPTSRAPVLGRSPRMLTAPPYASPSSRFKEEWLDSAEPLSSPEVRMLPALSGRRSNTNGIAGNGSRAFRKKRESDRSAWRMREMLQGRGGGTARRREQSMILSPLLCLPPEPLKPVVESNFLCSPTRHFELKSLPTGLSKNVPSGVSIIVRFRQNA